MKTKVGLLFIIGIVLGLIFAAVHLTLTHNEEEPTKIVNHDDDDFHDDSPVDDVVNTVIVKNVYVSEDDYSIYDVDEEVDASYWYVYYQMNNDHTGYKMVEIDVPYFDLDKVRKAIKPNATEEDFVGITYFNRVSFDSWKTYKKMSSDIQ